jgi:MFS family permease
MTFLLSYLRLAAAHPRFIAFGFTMTFAGSVGQTIIIGAVGPSVRSDFALSHTAWGALYMAGTLASAAILPWSGQMIDRYPLRLFSLWVCLGLVAACAVMAAAPAALMLILAIFLLRQTGQALANHTAATATARFLHTDRGKGLALVTLGDAVGKALVPLIIVFAIGIVGWRAIYAGMAVVIAVGILPLVLWLLRPYADHPAMRIQAVSGADGSAPDETSWSRGRVLRDVRFHLLLPGILAPPFVLTAVFFHNLEIASVKGWSAAWMTGNYWIFSAGSIAASLAAGPLIDRITAARVLPAFLMPIVIAMLIVWYFDDAFWVLPYLLLMGLTGGISHTAVTVLWAEVYGLRHLGGIRALVVSLTVFSSALGPVAMGALMDQGVTVETICALMGLYCVAATGLMLLALKGYGRQAATG